MQTALYAYLSFLFPGHIPLYVAQLFFFHPVKYLYYEGYLNLHLMPLLILRIFGILLLMDLFLCLRYRSLFSLISLFLLLKDQADMLPAYLKGLSSILVFPALLPVL